MSKEQRAMIDAMLRQPRPSGPASVEDLRAGFRTMMATMLVPDGIRTTAATLGSRPALLVEPADRPRAGTILYFHGGSFVLGSPETALSLTGNLVARTGIRALSLDYRLAPEHPFPAAIDDAESAYRALLDGGEDPATIAFAGVLEEADEALDRGHCSSPSASAPEPGTGERTGRCRARGVSWNSIGIRSPCFRDVSRSFFERRASTAKRSWWIFPAAHSAAPSSTV